MSDFDRLFRFVSGFLLRSLSYPDEEGSDWPNDHPLTGLIWAVNLGLSSRCDLYFAIETRTIGQRCSECGSEATRRICV
jgi:hypothetical protein